jgi:glutaredoxin
MNVTIYSKDNCSYCTNAKVLLSSKGIQYNEFKLNEDFTKESLQQLFPSATTFPVIVVDGFNIGGFNQLQKMLNEQTNATGKFLTEG